MKNPEKANAFIKECEERHAKIIAEYRWDEMMKDMNFIWVYVFDGAIINWCWNNILKGISRRKTKTTIPLNFSKQCTGNNTKNAKRQDVHHDQLISCIWKWRRNAKKKIKTRKSIKKMLIRWNLQRIFWIAIQSNQTKGLCLQGKSSS